MSEVPCSTKGVVTDGDVSRLSDQTAAESRFQTTSQRPRATQAHDCLCALLDQEDYLSKVLGCLIDDGLHECRRVCRKWRNVCSALPVHLIRVPWEHLPDTHLTFPKAASLSVATKTMCRGLPEFLPSLTNIRRLTLTGMSLWHCTCLRQIFPRQLCDHLPSLPQLESLTLEGVLEHTSAFLSLTADHLTRLTQLKIDLKLGSGWDMEPLFQVRKLRSLSLDLNHLFTTNGSLTFPSLTRLTRLEVTYAMTFDTDILMVRPQSKRLTLGSLSRLSLCLGAETVCGDTQVTRHFLSLPFCLRTRSQMELDTAICGLSTGIALRSADQYSGHQSVERVWQNARSD